ncbi:MAG: polymerase subunit delta [Bacteroidota bacterium]
MSFQQLLGDLKKKIYAPVYFLHGEEPYFIDEVVQYMEEHILTESEKEFNQSILYGKDIDMLTLLSYAKRYPMLSNYQLVIVKEAQELRSLVEKEGSTKRDPLVEYIQKPTPTTILVLAYKHKTLDKRTKLYKELAKHAVLLESKRLYDRDVSGWVTQYVLSKSYRIHPKAAMMMAEYLGADLSKAANEADKLMLSLQPGDEILPSMVEEKIGVSKDFNIFELYTALATRNVYKANLITRYFAKNPKNNPIQLTLPSIYSFFNKILTLHAVGAGADRNKLAASIGVSPYFVQEYIQAAKTFPIGVCMRNIGYLRDYDLRSKGIGSDTMNDGDLLKELVYKLLH